MKIAHICTNNGFIDNWGYQDNLLPVYVKNQGVDNIVIAANRQPSTYLNGIVYPIGEKYVNGIKIVRLKSWLLTNSIVVTFGLYKTLYKYNPDVIMHHNLNYTSLVVSSIFCLLHGKKMIVDSHVDEYNTRKSHLYRWIYCRVLIGGITNIFSRPIKKFYGVSLGRCDFLENVFYVSKDKIDFLPLGVDVDQIEKIFNKEDLRKKYNICKDDFVIVTGGKMGIYKGTIDLSDAVESLVIKGYRIRLITFGSYVDNLTESYLDKKTFVLKVGWCDRVKTLELLKLADLACWPVHHTTLCEDAIGCCTPLLLRKTRTTEHLILENGLFMRTGSKDELVDNIKRFLNMGSNERKIIYESSLKMKEQLSYKTIAKKLIDDCRLIIK